VRPHLQKMADGSGGRYLEEDIEADIKSGHFQLWIVIDGAEITCVTITQIMEYPRLRALRVVGLVGHRPRRWMHFMGHLELTAKQHFGCDRIEAMTQPRHIALLPRDWNVFHVLSEKVL